MKAEIIFIHGAFANGSVWRDIVPIFENAGYICHCPTLFANLRIKENPAPELAQLSLYDYILQIKDLANEILERTKQKPIIIGHSMGGLLVQKLAQMQICSSAVAITPAPCSDCAILSPIVAFTHLNIALQNNPNKSYKVWKFGAFWGVLNGVEKAKRQARNDEFVFESGRALHNLAYPNLDINQVGIIDETQINCPMLIIGAKNDKGTLVATHRKMAQKYAKIGAKYIEYANAAHMIIWENTAPQMTADIIEFLAAE